MFTDATDAVRYTLAGKATVTLKSTRPPGRHFTYQVTRAKEKPWAHDLKHRAYGERARWFVALLTGPSNTEDYQYLGMIDHDRKFRLTRGSTAGDDALSVKAFRYFWEHAQTGSIPEQLEVYHENHCGRCGLTLTTPESVTRGIGPECAKKMGLA